MHAKHEYLPTPRAFAPKPSDENISSPPPRDATAHWATSVPLVIDAHLTKYLYRDYSIQPLPQTAISDLTIISL